jgi:hypothetical protein
VIWPTVTYLFAPSLTKTCVVDVTGVNRVVGNVAVTPDKLAPLPKNDPVNDPVKNVVACVVPICWLVPTLT